MKVRLIPSETYPICASSFTINGKPYHHLRIPYNPLFQVAKEISLSSTNNKLEAVFMVLSEQATYVPVEESKQIISDAKKYLGVKLQLQLNDVAAGIISNNDSKQIVDSLDPSLLSLALRLVYEQVDIDRAQELTQNTINHLDKSLKDPQSKKIYKNQIENTRNSVGNRKKAKYVQKIQSKDNNYQQQESVFKPNTQHVRKQLKYYTPPDNSSNYVEKKQQDQRDERIKLALLGNSTSGWRQKLRPIRYINVKP